MCSVLWWRQRSFKFISGAVQSDSQSSATFQTGGRRSAFFHGISKLFPSDSIRWISFLDLKQYSSSESEETSLQFSVPVIFGVRWNYNRLLKVGGEAVEFISGSYRSNSSSISQFLFFCFGFFL